LPAVDENFKCLVFNPRHFFLLRGGEAFQNNGDKHVEKDDRHDKHERDKVCFGYRVATAFDPIFSVHEALVNLALKQYGSLPSRVMHQFIPSLPRGHPK